MDNISPVALVVMFRLAISFGVVRLHWIETRPASIRPPIFINPLCPSLSESNTLQPNRPEDRYGAGVPLIPHTSAELHRDRIPLLGRIPQ